MHYSNDNLARKLNNEDIIKTRQPQVQRKARIKQSKLNKSFLFCAFVAFAIALLIVTRYAQINEIEKNILDLEKKIYQLDAQNKQTRIKLDSSIDLKKLENIAVTKLNMHKPSRHQLVYVELKNSDKSQVFLKQEEKSPFSALMQGVSYMLAYLN